MRSVTRLLLALLVACCLAVPAAHAQGILGLQPANWSALATGGGIYCAQNNAIGNVGAVGSVIWQQGCKDAGKLILSGTFSGSGAVSSGVVVDAATVKAAASNALAVSSAAAALSCTQGSRCGSYILSNVTLNGGAGQNVLNVPIILLGNGNQITINSPADSTFVVNVSLLLTMLPAKVVVTGGIAPENVLINFTGVLPVTLGAGSSVKGILLAPQAAVLTAGDVTPELIGQAIAFGGGTEMGYVSDHFQSADGAVSLYWQQIAEDNLVILGNELAVDPADPAHNPFAAGFWLARFSNNQFSQVQVPADSGSDIQELIVRASGDSLTNRQWYQVYWDPAGKLQAGFYANNAAFPGGFYRDIGAAVNVPKNAGDVLRLEAVGSTLNVYVNGALKISVADTALTSGAPGVLVHGPAKADNWSGGNLQ